MEKIRLRDVDNGWVYFGVSAEIISLVVENIFDLLLCAPEKICINDSPSPSTRSLANNYYPRSLNIDKIVYKMFKKSLNIDSLFSNKNIPLDISDPSFNGPF